MNYHTRQPRMNDLYIWVLRVKVRYLNSFVTFDSKLLRYKTLLTEAVLPVKAESVAFPVSIRKSLDIVHGVDPHSER